MYPELQMQQMLQVDLLLSDANLTTLTTTWHGAPSQVNQFAKGFTSSAPHKKLQDRGQKLCNDQDPRTTHLEGNLAPFNHRKGMGDWGMGGLGHGGGGGWG